MTRVIQVLDKSNSPDAPLIVVVPPATSTVVTSGIRLNKEYAARIIHNTTANDCYIAVGQNEVDNQANYHIHLLGNQTFDITLFGPSSVAVYSGAGTTISVVTIRRDDVNTHANIKPS
jgi:hypothetical protein